MNQDNNQKKSGGAAKWLLIGGIALIAIIAAAGVAIALMGNKMTSREIAEAYVDEEIERASETMASWIGGQHAVLQAIDADWIQEKIDRQVRWTFSESKWIAGDRYNVEAVATARFEIPVPFKVEKSWIGASLPYDIVVDERQQAVLSMNARYTDATWESDVPFPDINALDALKIPGMDDIAQKVAEEVVEKVVEDIVEDAQEEAEQAIEDAKEEIQDAIGVDKAKDALDNIPGFSR